MPKSTNGSFISVTTPNMKEKFYTIDNTNKIEEEKHVHRKSRHSKNPSMISSGNQNTPYSIFLNVQPNINIIRGKVQFGYFYRR